MNATLKALGIPLGDHLTEWSRRWRRHRVLSAQRMLGHGPDDGTPVLSLRQLADVLPSTDDPAISDPVSTRRPTTFRELRAFVCEASPLVAAGIRPGVRCGIALPNGPDLAVCLVATIAVGVAVPVNPERPEDALAADLEAAGVEVLILPRGSQQTPLGAVARRLGVPVLELHPREEAGLFDLVPWVSARFEGRAGGPVANAATDVVLLLTTSGTSGTKKVVPIVLQDLCVGACCIAASLQLGPLDCGLNMMPLFHSGGIYRNVFAPLLAGSPMVHAPGFDPDLFWRAVQSSPVTWYYAAPTMHRMILDEGAHHTDASVRLRFIANAAGALLPETQQELQSRFGARVLPSYGMTECMPISCPPLQGAFPARSSGRVLGAEVSIRTAEGCPLPRGTAGRVMLRGAPVMRGYEGPDAPPVRADGWFDTGDLGVLDDDDFLTITGRSKEVINRGGEIISPFEVESALLAHPDVSAALAFVVRHDVLDEVVGAVIVAERRPDLRSLHAFLRGRLHLSKWPVVLVFMEALPRSHANKTMRIGLARRLGLGAVDERSPQLERLFEADCPAPGTDRREPIVVRRVSLDLSEVRAVVARLHPAGESHVWATDDGVCLAVSAVPPCPEALREQLRGELHDVLVPYRLVGVEALPRRADGTVDEEALACLEAQDDAPVDELERILHGQWAELLQAESFGRRDDFFELGGGSLIAVQLAGRLRRQLAVPLESMVVFQHRTIAALAQHIRSLEPQEAPEVREVPVEVGVAPSSTALLPRLVQALPILTFFPARRVAGWLLFIVFWVNAHHLWGASRSGSLIAALLATAGATGVGFPLLGIAAKWILIGRYRAGSRALWGGAYLRWWWVNQWLSFTGLGLFGASYGLTATYWRLLGASVGRRTRILADVHLGEADLVTLGDDVCVDSGAVLRPFSMEAGRMTLAPITIGAGATIGVRALVEPGTEWPAGRHLPPGASARCHPRDADEPRPGLCRPHAIHPPLRLRALAHALVAANRVASWLPLYVFLLLIPPLPSLVSWHAVASWFLLPEKMAAYLSMRVSLALVSPFLYFGGVVLLKRWVIGRFRAGAGQDRPLAQFRRYLMWRLLPDGTFGGLGTLLGSNFGAISTLYRSLGARVGQRIYWPGTGHQLIEYDLFTCGDDVTFGSRTTLLASDGEVAQPIVIEDGATVADRCSLAPGTHVQRNAVLGTGTTTPPGFVAPPGSTWLGFDGRRPIEVESGQVRPQEAATMRPFGRALFLGQASYRVLPAWVHAVLNLVLTAFGASVKAGAFLVALALALPVATAAQVGVVGFGGLLLASFVVVHAGLASAMLAASVASKWWLLGRRVPGAHPWDASPYCQRWKVHQAIQRLHQSWLSGRSLLDLLGGSAYLVDYLRALGATVGRDVCLYPNGSDPMATEPDLLTIGDGATIDRAILVAHLNTRGQWELGPITIGRGVSLKSDARVLLWGAVEDGARLAEHTLVLGGDVVQRGEVWEGWPGRASWGAVSGV
ncbi:MAG: AMP-binding protein [Myxococcales bacterium]|nr:AMP-binding protein [Myxococcales bacterium]